MSTSTATTTSTATSTATVHVTVPVDPPIVADKLSTVSDAFGDIGMVAPDATLPKQLPFEMVEVEGASEEGKSTNADSFPGAELPPGVLTADATNVIDTDFDDFGDFEEVKSAPAPAKAPLPEQSNVTTEFSQKQVRHYIHHHCARDSTNTQPSPVCPFHFSW